MTKEIPYLSLAQWLTLLNSRTVASTAQQNANNASILGLSQQQAALQNDANTLVNLQAGAQSATGQLQALGYANQLLRFTLFKGLRLTLIEVGQSVLTRAILGGTPT